LHACRARPVLHHASCQLPFSLLVVRTCVVLSAFLCNPTVTFFLSRSFSDG
jgi:hypothetical protein